MCGQVENSKGLLFRSKITFFSWDLNSIKKNKYEVKEN